MQRKVLMTKEEFEPGFWKTEKRLKFTAADRTSTAVRSSEMSTSEKYRTLRRISERHLSISAASIAIMTSVRQSMRSLQENKVKKKRSASEMSLLYRSAVNGDKQYQLYRTICRPDIGEHKDRRVIEDSKSAA